MAGPLTLAWDDRLTGYDFGPGHPLAPVRVELTMALSRELGVLELPSVSLVDPAPADMDELTLVHDPAYIDAVRQAGRDGLGNLRYGLGTPDNPVFAGMHEASALVAGATLAAARAVWRGEALHAANIAGGLHHAMRRSASGFCVYNDPAIAISWLLDAGAQRVAYVDLDVHHGDGVQAAFYHDPRVLTISLHEHPATLFPGTGLASEIGSGDGRGYAVNMPLPAFTGDAGWLRAFDAVVPAAAARLPARGAGQPARLRQPPARPAGPPRAQHRCAAARRAHGARPGPRGRRRPVAAHRWRRIRAGPGRAEVVDPSAGGRGGRPGRPHPGRAGPLAGPGHRPGRRRSAHGDDGRAARGLYSGRRGA